VNTNDVRNILVLSLCTKRPRARKKNKEILSAATSSKINKKNLDDFHVVPIRRDRLSEIECQKKGLFAGTVWKSLSRKTILIILRVHRLCTMEEPPLANLRTTWVGAFESKNAGSWFYYVYLSSVRRATYVSKKDPLK
jgi:hypothetical protein